MNTNRRGWVKNAIIIFLIIMLILTFFSNTIMNYSLPEVAAQYTQSGSITAKIRTSATVKANQTHKITIDESRTVLSVAVKDGQDVKVGDVLFYLEDAESTQLKTARETLASLEKQYRLKQLESGVDYYSDELAISQKRDELTKAQKALEKITGNANLIDDLKAEIKQLTADQKELNKQITAYNNQISKLKGQAADVSLDGETTAERIASAQVKLDAAKTEYDAAELKKEQTAAALEAAEAEYTKATEAYEALDVDGSTSAKQLNEQIAEKQKIIKRYKEDYELKIKEINDKIDEAYDSYVDADFRYNSALVLYNQGSGSYDNVEKWRVEAENRYQTYVGLLDSQNKVKESEKLAYDRQMEDYNEQLSKLEEQLKNIAGTEKAKNRLDAATKNRKVATTAANSASEEFDKKKTEYTDAKTTHDSLVKLEQLEGCEASVEKLNDQLEQLTETISDKNDELKDIGDVKDVESQQETIKNLQQDLTTLQHNLAKKKEENSLQNQRDQIEMDELVEKINEAKEQVAKFEANSVDAKILATVDGQVTSISAANGSETTMGQTLCEIVVTELGYSCEINLTAEQSKRVRTGDEVTISNNWWSNIKGTISSVRNDPKNPGQNKIATITLTGDVTVGQSLNLTIGEKGQTYDTVVPNSAVREDNNGKFVLAVEAKSSPLGNRYIAKRVDVNVLASDDTNSAISGVMGSEFIITTSTKPISAGMQVRMAENSK